MRKVFISYHHRLDQDFKDDLVHLAFEHDLFIDWSVELGEIDEGLDNQTIRRIIRDDYLRDSSVTLLLVGQETRFRKHVDWELKSSMINGAINRKSGIVVVNLPSTECKYYTAAHEGEKELYPDCPSWTSVTSRAEYERRYKHMPARIIDNLLKPKAKISITSWDRIVNNPPMLRMLVENAAANRMSCDYDLTRKMRMNNGPEKPSRPIAI